MQKFTKSVSISELLQAKSLRLELVCGKRYLGRTITNTHINRPGLVLCGQLDHFHADAIQLFGKAEQEFCLNAEEDELQENILKMLTKDYVPCVIMAADLKPLPALKQACKQALVPILRTSLKSTEIIARLRRVLDERLAPVTHLHGVLLSVSGGGVLIRGEAGIGKSECAVELIKRGHILIADDVVEIQRRGDRLIGSCPEMLKHYMEVRGLGILDIDLLFGISATSDETPVGMEVLLVPPAEKIDRLGVDQKTTTILGVEIPSLTLPVTPGRNLAVLIEVAALNQQLKAQGIFSAKEFSRKMLNRMKTKAKEHATKA